MVYEQPAEYFMAKDMVEEGALEEVRVRLYVITAAVAKLDIFCRIVRTPLPLPISIV